MEKVSKLEKWLSGKNRTLVQVVIRLMVFAVLAGLMLSAGSLVDCGWVRHYLGRVGQLFAVAIFFAVQFILFGWVLYCCHRHFRNWICRIVWFGILFVWISVSFFAAPVEQSERLEERSFMSRILTVSSRASATFFSRRSGSGHFTSVVWQYNYQWLQICIALYVCALMFSFWGRASFNRLRAGLTVDRHKNVFWGLTERDLLLARSIVRADALAQIQINLPIEKSYDPIARARLTDLADELDAFWSFVDFSNPGPKCHQGGQHFFLSEDGHANLALANRLVETFLADENAYTEKVLYVRAGDVDHDEVFSSWAQNAYEKSGHLIRPMIVRESEMIARKYAEDCHPLSAASLKDMVDYRTATVKDARCRTLLLGFDHTGRALLNVRLALSRFVGSNGRSTVAFPITVVDMKQERWERYQQMAPEIVQNKEDYGLDFLCMKVGFDQFERWFHSHHSDYDRYVFCLPGDAFNIREALRVRDILIEGCDAGPEKEIIVHVSDPSVYDVVSADKDKLPLKYFGNLKEIYSRDFMNGDPVDRVARVLNWQWTVNQDLGPDAKTGVDLQEPEEIVGKELEDEIQRIWEDTTYYNRLSSRSSAMGGLSFFRLMGFGCVLRKDANERKIVPTAEVEARIRDVADVMARTEHLRWCTYLRTLGIRKWDLIVPRKLADVVREEIEKAKADRADERIIPNGLAKQVDRFRRHAALVEFDALPQLDRELAVAVDPDRFGKMKEGDFVGQKRLEVWNRKTVSTLQGKDYDCWRVMPKAIELAGFCFARIESDAEKDHGERKCKQSNSSGPMVTPRCDSHKGAWRWLFRGSRAVEYPLSRLTKKKIEELVRLAKWVVAGYKDDVQPPNKEDGGGDFARTGGSSKQLSLSKRSVWTVVM